MRTSGQPSSRWSELTTLGLAANQVIQQAKGISVKACLTQVYRPDANVLGAVEATS